MSTETSKSWAKRPVTVMEISENRRKIMHGEPAGRGVRISKAHVAALLALGRFCV